MNEYDRNIVSLLSKLFTMPVMPHLCGSKIILPERRIKNMLIFFTFGKANFFLRAAIAGRFSNAPSVVKGIYNKYFVRPQKNCRKDKKIFKILSQAFKNSCHRSSNLVWFCNSTLSIVCCFVVYSSCSNWDMMKMQNWRL